MLRANGLMLRRKKFRPRTTDSRHGNKIYPDLLNTCPKFVASAPGELVVCDITYVRCREGFGYLSLVTDTYSRLIVGYALRDTLETDGPLSALKMALESYRRFGVDISHLIHHSDRGVQYTSFSYVNMLKDNNIRISMTQTGDPLHNAMAERMNGIIKGEWLLGDGNLSLNEMRKVIEQAVKMYNTARPHQGIGMKTPYEMMGGKACNPLL